MDNELELLIEPDFLIREQSLLLSRFEGLNIDSTCGSHIRTEEWIPHNDREGSYLVLYYFILGLDRVINRKDSENDTVTNYEYYGQEINREVFGDGVRRPADEFMFLPFDDIHGHLGNPKIQQLYFDCPHLYFKKLDTSITDNKKLESGLLDLYEKYEALTDLVIVPQYYPGFRINNLQFSVDNYDYVRNRIAAENGGSVDNYLNSAVGQCLERQQHSIQIWKEIGNLCKDILYP